jgi:hypothetical protein
MSYTFSRFFFDKSRDNERVMQRWGAASRKLSAPRPSERLAPAFRHSKSACSLRKALATSHRPIIPAAVTNSRNRFWRSRSPAGAA